MISGEVVVCPQCQRHVFPYPLYHDPVTQPGEWYECPRCAFVWRLGRDSKDGCENGCLVICPRLGSHATPPPAYANPAQVNQVLASSGLQVAGYDIPWWAVAGAAAGAFFLFSGRHR